MINVDGFGKINESLGAEVGNTILQTLSRRLMSPALATQAAARSGSDEFLLLLSVPPTEDFRLVGASLMDLLCAPVEAAGLSLVPSVTLGISPVLSTPPQRNRSTSIYGETESLLVYAAAAVREARKGGPGRIQVFDDKLRHQALRRQELLLALQGKDLLDQLHLVYQPQLRLRDGACIGLEALLRWTHPVLGTVSPGEFIPLMESSGSMITIGRWVLHAACQQVVRWRSQGFAVPTVSINASAIEFLDPDYPGRLSAAMQQYGLAQDALAVEVTESLAIGDLALADRQLAALLKAGVQVHLDDFGSGYAHLRSLRGLQAETVKIDRSLVEGLESDEGAVTMLRAIVQLVHGLGRQVLVEGIETEGEARIARELGCDAAQGYFFGRPVRPEDIRLDLSPAAST
jgi:diguanylate cyclase (GGDEF)-like protein